MNDAMAFMAAVLVDQGSLFMKGWVIQVLLGLRFFTTPIAGPRKVSHSRRPLVAENTP